MSLDHGLLFLVNDSFLVLGELLLLAKSLLGGVELLLSVFTAAFLGRHVAKECVGRRRLDDARQPYEDDKNWFHIIGRWMWAQKKPARQ